MKYKILKTFFGIGTGIKYVSGEEVDMSFSNEYGKYLLDNGFIEEIKEGETPKFKIGDYAIQQHNDGTVSYQKIDHLYYDSRTKIWSCSGVNLSKFRLPTQEELGLYFR